MAEIDLGRARDVCTAAELKLVEAAASPAVDSLTRAQLARKVDRARKLRDKWRDVHAAQRRATQAKQGARATEKNARSREKSRIFAAALQRFQAALKRSGKAESVPPKRRPAKSQRTAEHRRKRAGVRARMTRKKAEENAVDPPTRPVAKRLRTTPAPANEAPSLSSGEPLPAAPPSSLPIVSPLGSPERPAPSTAGAPATQAGPTKKRPPRVAAGGGVRTDRGQQVNARGAANRARVRASGLDTRIRGHVSARTKRDQARRDGRKS